MSRAARAILSPSWLRLPHESDELFVPVDAEVTGSLADVGLSAPRFFPSPLVSTADGLVCVGGRLTPEWLLDAYRHGIFPWPVWDDEPMAWWSLDPRAILELDVLARLAATATDDCGAASFQVTCDRDFAGVIHGCATAGDRGEGTWLTPAMIAAYAELHRLGHAHSVEVWQDGRPGGRHLRRRDRRAVRRREHVLSRARRVEGGGRASGRPSAGRAATSCSTSSSGRRTPAGWVR